MIIAIAALSENRVIGQNGQLPWRIPEDLKRFKDLTMGHPVIMGRKTWESIPEKFRPLPGRTNIVVTRQPDYAVPADVIVSSSVEDALKIFPSEHIYIIGGAEIYAAAMPHVDKIEMTLVKKTIEGDGLTYFPDMDMAHWKELRREDHDEFSFVTYERV
nr:Dihydrofolate reductase [uncultured bacterium]